MSCGMPQVSGWPGLGGGLLRGMMVGCMSFAEELPGLTFTLLTFSASGARPSWADEQLKIQMLTLRGYVYSNISAAILVSKLLQIPQRIMVLSRVDNLASLHRFEAIILFLLGLLSDLF